MVYLADPISPAVLQFALSVYNGIVRAIFDLIPSRVTTCLLHVSEFEVSYSVPGDQICMNRSHSKTYS